MRKFVLPLMAVLITSACVDTIPKEALEITAETLQHRQAQTRRFGSGDEGKLLAAGAQVLQDLGFTLDESETRLGLIVGSKDRDASEVGQIAGAVAMAILFGVAMPVDDRQKIRASLVSRPIGDNQTALRVTFQRIVWNTRGEISRIEGLDDAKIYQEFFSKLSQSAFLTANEI